MARVGTLPPNPVHMSPVRILVDSLADEGLPNAQMTNAREIVRRMDPERFYVSIFNVNRPDQLVVTRPNTRLIPLPQRRQTVRIFQEFVSGNHQILFYVKASPASKWYLRLRRYKKDNRVVIGTLESQSDLRNEPTIAPEAVRLWENTVLRCDYLFSNSAAVRRSLQSEYGLSSEIVPTGVDTKFFTPRWERTPNARPRVLFVGSLRPFKQPQILLEAAARFPQADFVLAGDGIMAQELRARIQHERLGNVTLLGAVGAQEVRQQCQQADVFLFPSLWEGLPKVILEAAACGLPVIARNNYQPETVVDTETGYLVASDAELFAQLEKLLSNPILRRTLGEAGRKHSERFDWGVITRQWEEIFERLVSRKAGGHGS
jgi:glycosyltransferase involved in cell wall biosynthesis